MVDKRGQLGAMMTMRNSGSMVGIIVLAVIGIIIFALVYDSNSTADPRSATPVKFGEAIGQPELNWVSYIIGGVPDFLIDWTNPISASIIVITLFVMLFVVFSDILGMFGTFSSQSINYLIGFALALIAANLKLIMFIAVWSMILTSGLGVIGAFVGIAVPFILFIAIHVMLGSNFWRHRRDMAAFRRGANDLTQGVEGIKSFGRAVRGDGDGTIPVH